MPPIVCGLFHILTSSIDTVKTLQSLSARPAGMKYVVKNVEIVNDALQKEFAIYYCEFVIEKNFVQNGVTCTA